MSPRVECLSLPPDYRAPSMSRRFVSETLARWQLEPLDATAVLLTSELVTNAVVHAQTDIALCLQLDGRGCVTVSVADGSPATPQLKSRADVASGGGGLVILDELADSWQIIPEPSGKTVRFTLQAPGPALEA